MARPVGDLPRGGGPMDGNGTKRLGRRALLAAGAAGVAAAAVQAVRTRLKASKSELITKIFFIIVSLLTSIF